MKQIVMERGNPFLPQEILRKILTRLPSNSLIRFQCVCKDWENLFKTPSFIQEHLQFSRQNPCLLFEQYEIFHPLRSYLPDREMQVGGVQTSPQTQVMWSGTIVCSCNGLLCVECSCSTHPIRLWNPAIREVRLVPQSAATPMYESDIRRIGFGFCSFLNDYKIVSILDSDDLVTGVEVYSLSTDSWKEVEFDDLDDVAVKSSGKSFNGAILWFGFMPNEEEEVENDHYLLVSYDIATEVFTLIPLPILAPTYHDSCRNKLAVHENKLALLSHTTMGDYESSLIDLRVMEENTGASMERWSWSKKFSISHPCLLLPGTIWRNEIVCHFVVLRGHVSATAPKVKDDERNIVLVNLTTNESKRISIPKNGSGYGVLNYVESLVPVGTKYAEKSRPNFLLGG